MASIGGRFVSTSITVGTSAAVLLPATAATNRRSMSIHNNGSEIVYLGGSNVTSTNGYPLAAGDSIPIDINANAKIYGRTSANSSNVRLLEGCG